MNRINTTEGRVYLVTLDGKTKIEAQFVPGEIVEDRTNRLQAVPVVARSNDQFQYTGGEDTINLKLQFYADDDNRESAIQKVRDIQAIGMSDGPFGKAKRVKFIFGKLYRRHVWSIKKVSSNLSNFDNFNNYYPLFATVDIQLVLNPINNRRRSSVSTL